MVDGTLTIYYSTAFPKFAAQQRSLENRDPALATSFVKRYEIWIAVHSLLRYQDEQMNPTASASETGTGTAQPHEGSELAEERDRQERCRVAILSALFAAREVQAQIPQTLPIADS